MTFIFIYQLFQIHFPIDSLSHLNIIYSFIIYYFLTTTRLPTFFYSTSNYYNRKKKGFKEWTVAHQTWWATVHEQKKFRGIESLLEILFLVSLSIIESILFLATPLEMLLEQSGISWRFKWDRRLSLAVVNKWGSIINAEGSPRGTLNCWRLW